MRNIYLIYGRSGVGKSSVADLLCERYGYSQIASYTDRKPRFVGERNHVFISQKEFNTLRPDMVAYTMFDGHQYGVTAEAIDHNDIYVIDKAGIENLRKNYHGPKGLVVIWLVASTAECERRMAARGDSSSAIRQRMAFDAVHNVSATGTDWVIYNEDLDQTVAKLHKIITDAEARV